MLAGPTCTTLQTMQPPLPSKPPGAPGAQHQSMLAPKPRIKGACMSHTHHVMRRSLVAVKESTGGGGVRGATHAAGGCAHLGPTCIWSDPQVGAAVPEGGPTWGPTKYDPHANPVGTHNVILRMLPLPPRTKHSKQTCSRAACTPVHCGSGACLTAGLTAAAGQAAPPSLY